MLVGHNASVNSVAWNPAGTRIVSGSHDKTLRIWDAETGKSLQTLEGHESLVYSVAWNLASTRIVSGSEDHTLRIWDAATGTSLQTLEGHKSQVHSVAWNPAGTRIVSGSYDHTLRIWESRLEDAIPFWRAASLRDELHRWIDSLFDEHVLLEPVLAALHADRSHSEVSRQGAIRLAESRLDPSASDLNSAAWDLVDPDREEKDTDVALALRMTRVAIELTPANYALRDTLAWALFANGLHDEALVESAKALELADEADKDDYQGYLDRMRAMVKEARADPSTSDLPGDDR
jgi:tetratricopeptide (TPR) repeat protein